jgi:hypothetical protein
VSLAKVRSTPPARTLDLAGSTLSVKRTSSHLMRLGTRMVSSPKTMPSVPQKFRVLIATTTGPAEVLLLTEEDPAIGRCVACIGGTTETADIAAAYHAFVVRPTGVVESLFGHSCYRLDVSCRIDAGSSWQLGVLAAHALHATGRLAQENDPADGIIWATGSVRPVDLTVGAVSHLPEKVATSTARLQQEVAAGRRVILAMSEQNAARLPAPVKTELSTAGIELLELVHTAGLFAALGLNMPAAVGPKTSARTSALSAPALNAANSVTPHPSYLWAAVLLLCVAAATAYLVTRASNVEQKPESPAAPAVQSEARVLVPELVPFVTERERMRIRDVYMPAPGYKAVAMSPATVSFVTAQPDEAIARTAALDMCQQITDRRRAQRRRPHVDCDLYAVGNVVVSKRGNPPMPSPPWLVRDPKVETPFEVSRLPLRQERQQPMIEQFQRWRKPRALAVSATLFYNDSPGDTTEDAVRRTLEWCGYNSGSACLIIAVDDVFVVPIPTSMKVTGLLQSGPIYSIASELRDDVARTLLNARSGWNAVAVGASGRVGLKLGADSEQASVAGALDACAEKDRACRVVVIGPFRVGDQARATP